jgi:hypothetical protein
MIICVTITSCQSGDRLSEGVASYHSACRRYPGTSDQNTEFAILVDQGNTLLQSPLTDSEAWWVMFGLFSASLRSGIPYHMAADARELIMDRLVSLSERDVKRQDLLLTEMRWPHRDDADWSDAEHCEIVGYGRELARNSGSDRVWAIVELKELQYRFERVLQGTVMSDNERSEARRMLDSAQAGRAALDGHWVSYADRALPRWQSLLHSVVVGLRAPDLEGAGIDGKPLRLQDFRGNVVWLVFFGHW